MTPRAAVWYLDADGLHWFAFVPRENAPHVARRLNVMFGVAAMVADYWFEPTEDQKRPFYRMRQERALESGGAC